MMIYGSVCSGIEAATDAWHPLGWRPAFFSEIEAFPRAVLKHHYPEVPCHGDFTTIGADDYGPIELLVGGTPCQDFSVAGLRAGIAGERGNLTLEFLRLVARKKPRWIVWENVPGVLSSDGGRALGAFLGGLAELGYGFAYRVLDAQHFGLAQRRARVFVVGYLGDWRRAAAVLFERESLQGHPAPRRESRERIAGTIGARSCLSVGSQDAAAGHLIAPELSFCLNAGGMGRQDYGTETLIPMRGGSFDVAHSLRAEGFDASEDGTGRGTPIVPVAFQTRGSNIDLGQDVTGTIGSNADRASGSAPCIAFSVKDYGADAGPISPTLRAGGFDKSHANGGVMPAIAFGWQNSSKQGASASASVTPTRAAPHTANIRAADGGSSRSYVAASGVRRLTPTECERLL